MRTLKQTCLAVTQIIAIIVCLSAPLCAEAPSPIPTPHAPPPGPTTPPTASFSQALADMASRASTLLPILRAQIEGPLLPWLENLSMLIAGLVMIAAFAKMWRENAGAGVDLFWWFARLGIIFALLGSGPKILDGMYTTGREFAAGADGSSALFQLYVTQRGNFDTSYRVLQEGLFTVKGVPVPTVPGGILGVLLSTESGVEDPVRKLDTISMSMPLLFDSLNFSRGVITFGDFFLTMLGGFLMIVMRLAAPVMIALAIDRSLAQRVTYPFLWGAIVLTLIWPIVVLLIKAIAYMGGDVAMALGDKQLFYQFDDRTMQIIHSGSQHPFYTAAFAAVIMLIAGLSLWGAPYIAYQLSVGRVYEGVSTTISSWVGQVMGAGIEFYSASTAARITRQADVLQAEAGNSAEVTRATASNEAGERHARAARLTGFTNAEGSLVDRLAGINAGRTQQVMGAEAENKFNKTAIDAQKALAISDQNALWGRGLAETEVARAADTEHWKAQKILRATDWGADTARAITRERNKETGMKEDTTGGIIFGEGIRLAGSAVGFSKEFNAIQNRAAGNRSAIDNYFNSTNDNQKLYANKMGGANETRLTDLTKAADTSAEIASKGARGSYGITVGGYDQAYRLTLEGNEINRRGSIDAAKQVRDAAIEAARLRSIASIISSVGHNVARDLEQGLTLRY